MRATPAKPPPAGGLASRLQDTALWRFKARLQFSGWLQFMPPGLLGLLLLLGAGVVRLFVARAPVVFWAPVALGGALLARALYDVATAKLGWHPAEPLPQPPPEVDTFDSMRSRRSCRSFQHRDLTPEHRAALVEAAAQQAKPERLIGRSPVRLEYIAAPLAVWPVLGAHEFFVAIAPEAYDRLSVIDVGRSLQKVVMHATRIGVATCWIGPGADQRSVVAHLGARFDARTDHVICVCAIGYASRYLPLAVRGMNRVMSTRLPLSSLFFADLAFSAPLDVSAPPFAAYGRCFEVCQWSPSSYNAQTTRCVAISGLVDGRLRAVRFDFHSATTSRYYAAVALGIWCANWEMSCEALGRRGHFAVLAPEARGVHGAPALPRYDVSWVVDGDGP